MVRFLLSFSAGSIETAGPAGTGAQSGSSEQAEQWIGDD